MQIIQLLLDVKADVGQALPPRAEGAGDTRAWVAGETALHVAARNGSLDIAKKLVQYGAMFSSVTSTGRTPLHYAATNGHLVFLQWVEALMVERGVVDLLVADTA